MDEPTLETADAPTLPPREIVRRFDSKKNVNRARKRGIRFDPAKGNGIPATTTDIEPVNPDRIKEATGARNADAWMDINVTGKTVFAAHDEQWDTWLKSNLAEKVSAKAS